ncbi:MAG: sugar ABC transporter ATP-binding protein [Actinomycetota bacterium]|nr:sugar ABC transporter ATP-binding protein [Actinomycetota bacterium]
MAMTDRGPARADTTPALLALDSIEKWYEGTPALSGVSLACFPGEVHALIGENGSGKSTLLKVASGEVHPDGGQILVAGVPVRFHQPSDAIRSGIALIPQEVPLVRSLTVAENISLGALPTARLRVDWKACRRRAKAALALLGEHELDVGRVVDMLTADERQLVAIARALARGQRILLLDEPTSSLSLDQANRLFGVLRQLRSSGIAMVYVTQRLAELTQVADRVTVIRDGRVVAVVDRDDIEEGRIAEIMIGRALEAAPVATVGRERGGAPADALLWVDHLQMLPSVRDASLAVRGGEVVGVAGLVGSGASELLEALAGVGPHARGTAQLGGVPLPLGSVRATMARGVGYLPRDRRLEALVPALSVTENMLLSDLTSLWPPVIRRGRRRQAADLARRFSVRMPGLDAPAGALSGGNQQKLVMARVLARNPRLLLLNEPTRGVDVGAKFDIFSEVRAFAKGDKAALVYSSEFKDLIELCDRVVVLYRGHVVADQPAGSFTEEELIRLAGRGSAKGPEDVVTAGGRVAGDAARVGTRVTPEG